ncbi:ribonuclease H-like domain-containing protein [Tanacetum coccineum]
MKMKWAMMRRNNAMACVGDGNRLAITNGTLDLGLHLYASSTTSLVGYTDANWAGCPSTRRSTSGYCDFLGDNLLSWSAKTDKKTLYAPVPKLIKYRGVANVVAETAWLRNFLRAPVQDPPLYRSLAGGLKYLTFTRPDLSYAVQQICLYMHDPREPHLAALKRILRYVQGTLDLGIHLYASSTTSLLGYADANWAGFPSTRRSTSGYCDFLGDNLLSWSAKGQKTLSRSSAETEYRGVANVVAETAWLRNFLRELHSPLSTATLSTVRVLHVPSRFQNADIFTKGLPSALLKEFRSSLSVRPPPAPTVRAY